MASRYELKYLLSNSTALRVRQFVRQYLELDEYGQGQPDLTYPVHSLYLDSDDWTLYHRSLNGDKNHFKLRVRYYDERPTTPVFFEIKRRMKDVILKQRCGVKRGGETDVLAGMRDVIFFFCRFASLDKQIYHKFFLIKVMNIIRIKSIIKSFDITSHPYTSKSQKVHYQFQFGNYPRSLVHI